MITYLASCDFLCSLLLSSRFFFRRSIQKMKPNTTISQRSELTFELPYRLFSLRFSYFRLLISLLQNGLQSGSLDGTVEFHISSSCSLLWCLLLSALPMLSSIENSPSCVTRVPTHKVGFFCLAIGKIENLRWQGVHNIQSKSWASHFQCKICIVMVVQYTYFYIMHTHHLPWFSTKLCFQWTCPFIIIH